VSSNFHFVLSIRAGWAELMRQKIVVRGKTDQLIGVRGPKSLGNPELMNLLKI